MGGAGSGHGRVMVRREGGGEGDAGSGHGGVVVRGKGCAGGSMAVVVMGVAVSGFASIVPRGTAGPSCLCMPPLPPPPSYSSVRCALLTSRLTFTQVEITVGLAGIAAAMALCSSAATCSEFLVNGGLAVIVGEGIGEEWERDGGRSPSSLTTFRQYTFLCLSSHSISREGG